MHKVIKKYIPNFIHKSYYRCKYEFMMQFFPKKFIGDTFKAYTGYDMNWDNPQDLSQKINWMKVYSDQNVWARLADKYLVRDYVKERIGEEYLTKLYGVWDKAEDIDFNKLPKQFVLKTNHGCGTVLIVPDKSKLDIPETIKTLNQWIKEKFGRETVEPHYLLIKPKIYAEEFIENKSDFSTSLVDYKITCLDGKAHNTLITTDRVIGKAVRITVYDVKWNRLVNEPAGAHSGDAIEVPKPKYWDKMVWCAEKLAEGHPHARVDLYLSGDRIIFGEMTMTPQGGYLDYFTRQLKEEMGKLVTLPEKQ